MTALPPLFRWLLLAGCSLALGAACSSSSTTSSTDEASAEATRTGPPKAWSDMTKEERGKYMGQVVTPRMKELFQAYDPVAFADFGCGTCHGENRREVGFAMPNELPALYPTGHPKQKQMVADYPDMVKFMFNKALPEMRTLLGAEPFDDATKTGFSCFNCHPKGTDEAAAAPGAGTAP